MKYFIACLSVLVFAYSPANAFISNFINNISDTLNNAVNTVTSTVNTAVIAGQFLWDNALQPSLQVLQENGANFIDNYFGGLLNAIGKRNVDKLLIESQKSFITDLFMTQTSAFIANLKVLFLNLLNDVKNTIQSSLISIILGQTTIQQVLAEIIKTAKVELLQLVQQTISSIMTPSRSLGLENLASQLANIVNQMSELLLNQFNGLISSLISQIPF
ncbi:unnamed protein product [Brachionus calyciflorus]|uniref:Uncharacterized protein n=1 Tax=Brachionus calyciflorus TaxID=104777 RepID=A0A813V0B1_9BILA|nr:unnamed protein product [Brachionus calyciflorus]